MGAKLLIVALGLVGLLLLLLGSTPRGSVPLHVITSRSLHNPKAEELAALTSPAVPALTLASEKVSEFDTAFRKVDLEAWLQSPPTPLQVLRHAASVYFPDMFDGSSTSLPPRFVSDSRNPCWSTHCLPSFLVLGVYQAGVRDLYQRLTHHPGVASRPANSPSYYSQVLPKWAAYVKGLDSYAPAALKGQLLGEASAVTFHFVWVHQEKCSRTSRALDLHNRHPGGMATTARDLPLLKPRLAQVQPALRGGYGQVLERVQQPIDCGQGGAAAPQLHGWPDGQRTRG